MAASRNRAFTLIELLVVLAIILAIVGLLVVNFAPARAGARRTVCANNLRNLYGFTQTYMNDHRGMVPYGFWADTAELTWDDLLLPYIDKPVTRDVIDTDNSTVPTTVTTPPSSIPTETDSFLCPDDDESNRRTYAMVRTLAGSSNLGIATFSTTSTPPQQYRMGQLQQPAQILLLTEWLAPGNTLGAAANSVIDSPSQHDQSQSRDLHPDAYNYLFMDGHVEGLRPEETVGKNPATGNPWPLSQPKAFWTRDPGDNK